MSFIFKCPYCKQAFEAEEQWIGKIATCPNCDKQIVIQHFDGNDTEFQGDGDGQSNQVQSDINIDGIKRTAQNTIRSAFKLDKLEGFNFSRFMRQIFKHHKWEEIEEYMTIGTPHNIPPLSEVQPIWPAPWLFVRMMVLTVALYLFLLWKEESFGIYIVLPLLITGVYGIPLGTLLFFWEVNIPRNISILTLLRIVITSSFTSIGVTFFFHDLIGGSPENHIWAGPIEETAKALVMLYFIIRNPKYQFKLNGLLIGAAVGAGFAIIETGGYTMRNGNNGTMELRALLAPFGHVAYSAIVGFALWRAKTAGGSFFSNLMSPLFIPLFALSIGLHMFWNSKLLNSEFLIKTAIVGVIEYFIIIYLIQEGINEIRKVKEDLISRESHGSGESSPVS